MSFSGTPQGTYVNASTLALACEGERTPDFKNETDWTNGDIEWKVEF